MIDAVLLVDRDSQSIPPTHVLRLSGHGAFSGFPECVTLEACESSEDATSHQLDVLASYGIDLSALVDAINLVMGREALILTEDPEA